MTQGVLSSHPPFPHTQTRKHDNRPPHVLTDFFSSSNWALVPKLPVQRTCCILWGTSIRWNFSGMAAARWGMWRSPFLFCGCWWGLMEEGEIALRSGRVVDGVGRPDVW